MGLYFVIFYNLKKMVIICPAFEKEVIASEKIIAELVPMINGQNNPFIILQKGEMTYIQTLWTPKGYMLEYQEGTVSEHYMLCTPTTEENAVWALQCYLNEKLYWKTKFKFKKKYIATPSYKLGHKIGLLFGRFLNN